MADPHFWTQRPCDESIKDITNFAGGGSRQSDSNSSPHTIEDLDLGEHNLYVSDGPNGMKRGPTFHKHETSFGRTMLDDFSPRVLCDLGFVESNPVLTARNGSGTNADLKRCEINDGDLASHANGGDATLEKWPDKSGTGNNLTPSSTGDGPDVVQGGSLVKTANGELTAEYATPDDLSVSLTDESAWTLALEAELTANAEVVATIDGAAVETDGSNVFVKLGGTNIATSTIRSLPSYSGQGFEFNDKAWVVSGNTPYYYDEPNDNWVASDPGVGVNSGTLTIWNGKLAVVDTDTNDVYTYDGSWSKAGTLNKTTYYFDASGETAYYLAENNGYRDELVVVDTNFNETVVPIQRTVQYPDTDLIAVEGAAYFTRDGDVKKYDGSVSEVLTQQDLPFHFLGYGGGYILTIEHAYKFDRNEAYYSDDGGSTWSSRTVNRVLEGISHGGPFPAFMERNSNDKEVVHWLQGGTWQTKTLPQDSAVPVPTNGNIIAYNNSSGGEASIVEIQQDKVSVPYTAGNEHSVVVGFDGSTLALNVDGTENTDTINIGRTSTDKLVLSDSGSPFTGTIRQVGLVPKLATTSERDTLAQKLGS